MGNKQEKVYAFIDSQNLYRSVQNDVVHKQKKIYKGWKIDYKKFFVYLKDKYKVSKTFLFIGYMKEYERRYRRLESLGYKLIYKPTLKYIDVDGVEKVKGNVDAELVLHAMIEISTYDKAIIVAGDGDYRCLVEYLDKQNKLGYLAIPNRHSFSRLLNDYRKYFVFISDLRGKLR